MYQQIRSVDSDLYIVFDDSEHSCSLPLDKVVGRVTRAKVINYELYIDVAPLNTVFGEAFLNMIQESPFMEFNPCMIGDILPNQVKQPYHFDMKHLCYFIPNLTGGTNEN
jgi:hypothetical protein